MTRKFLRIMAVTLSVFGALVVLPPAMADTVEMHLVSAGSDTSHGVFISPYYATINGGPQVPVICDDFTHDSYVPEAWIATVYAGSGDLSNTQMGAKAISHGWTIDQVNTAYDQIAYLALELSGADATSRALTSFAIWDIFEDTAVRNWLGAGGFLNDVLASVDHAKLNATAGARSGLTIYSAPITCLGAPCSNSNLPQEFVSTPEASASIFLGFDLMALCGAVFLVRRRAIRNAGAAV